jgi:hypothetical protein
MILILTSMGLKPTLQKQPERAINPMDWRVVVERAAGVYGRCVFRPTRQARRSVPGRIDLAKDA